jgi:hypothetical protein
MELLLLPGGTSCLVLSFVCVSLFALFVSLIVLLYNRIELENLTAETPRRLFYKAFIYYL